MLSTSLRCAQTIPLLLSKRKDRFHGTVGVNFPLFLLLLQTSKTQIKLGHKNSCLPSFILENKENIYNCWELGKKKKKKDNFSMCDTEVTPSTEPEFV